MALMLLASLLFLGTHLGISSTNLRGRLVAVLGTGGYLIAYSLIAVVMLGYLIWVYGALPRYEYFWLPAPALYLVPKVVIPVAAVLLVGGFMVRNPTAVGMESTLRGPVPQEQAHPDGPRPDAAHPDAAPPDAPATDSSRGDGLTRGVVRITRHPFQWAVVLWAAAHMAANGDRVSVVFFGTFAVLGLAGGVLIDRKKAASLGADWEPFAQVTSNVPFGAILTGRNRLALRELIAPVLVGLVTYAALYLAHPWIAGVRVA